jgi:hypothetical protein
VRILDHYLALNLAFSLLWTTFWAFDPTPDHARYFAWHSQINTDNIWAVWLSFVGSAFAIFNGLGYGDFTLNASGPIAVTSFHIVISRPFEFAVVAVLTTEAFMMLRQHQKAQPPPPPPPPLRV